MATNFNQPGKNILLDLFNTTNSDFTGIAFRPEDVEFSALKTVSKHGKNTEVKMKVIGNNRYKNASNVFYYNRLDIARWPLVENALLFRSNQTTLVRFRDLLPEINRICQINLIDTDINDALIPKATFSTGVNTFHIPMSNTNLIFTGRLAVKWVVLNQG